MEEIQQTIKNPYGFIYITTNMINGMKYLGQKSFDDNNKWKNYLGSGKALKNAIRKYGKQNFDRNIICFCYSPEELNEAEYTLSVFLNVVEDRNWYNLCYGGEVPIGYVATDEARSKMSEAQKARWTDELRQELGEKMSGEGNPFYGKHHTDDTRKTLSEQHTGMKASDEARSKMSQSQTERFKDPAERAKCGWEHTDKQKQAHSERMSGEGHPMFGKHHSEETKAKISEKHKKENLSEEVIQKYREAAKKRMTDEAKEYLRQINTGKKLSEEARNKISTANTGRKVSKETILKRLETIGVTKILQYDKSGNFIQLWDSAQIIESTLHISSSKVYACCNGVRKSAGGYVWRKEHEPLTSDQILELKAKNDNHYTGVTFNKRMNKWQAYIITKGKRKNLGSYVNRDDAIAARMMVEADKNNLKEDDDAV
jgi:group I intron endonuclease